jgi:hypothetical protein
MGQAHSIIVGTIPYVLATIKACSWRAREQKARITKQVNQLRVQLVIFYFGLFSIR